MANSVDSEEVAHYEPPHLNLLCLQIQLFSFLVLSEFTQLLKILQAKSLILQSLETNKNLSVSFGIA